MSITVLKDLIVQGNQSVAVIKEDGAVHRIESRAEFTPITLHNLQKDQPKIFNLTGSIYRPYEILTIEPNLSVDDDDLITGNQASDSEYSGRIIFRTIADGVVVNRIIYGLGSGRGATTRHFLLPGQKLEANANFNCSSVSLYCRPVFLNTVINIH